MARRLEAEGLDVETATFDGATHGFDQVERAPLSTLAFDPDATAAALRIAGAFLDRVGPPRP